MVANITSKWVGGNLVFYDAAGNVLLTFDAANHKLVFDANVQAVIAAVAAADGVAAAGAAPDKAEFDAVVTLANANKAAINAVISALKTAGIVASA